MDIAAQIVTMLAVLLGGATSYVANRLTERNRLKQEFKSRWDLRKLDSYAEFIGTVRAYIASAVTLYESHEGIRSPQRNDEELHAELAALGRDKSLAFERLMLLASDSVVEAAHSVQEAAAAVEWHARGTIAGTLAEWRAKNTAAFTAINHFHERARMDLGVTGRFSGDEHSARGLLLPPAPAGEPEASL